MGQRDDIYSYGSLWDKILSDFDMIKSLFITWFESIIDAIKSALNID